MIELAGYGVRLEPLRREHIPALCRIALDPSIWRYMNLRIGSPADVEELVEASLQDAATGAVEPWVTFVGDEAVGATRFLDVKEKHRTVEIGFTWLAEQWRGAGVNPRVKLLQLEYAFENRGFRRVALKTHHENLHSQKAMLKLGAKFEGAFRNHMIMPDGSTRHTRWYSIVAEEWPEVRRSLLLRIDQEPLGPPLR